MPNSKAPILTKILIAAAAGAIQSAAASPDTPITPADTPSVINSVRSDVVNSPAIQEAQKTLDEAMTPIPWYQSSVFMALLVSFISSVLGIVYGVTIPEHIQTDLIVPLLVTGVTTIVGLISRIKSPINPISKK